MGPSDRPKYDGGASRLRPTGTIVGGYRLGEKIDERGAGLVYRAVDTKLGRTVALKFLHPDLTRDPKARGRFVQEARAASSLDHPNICTIFQIDETDDGEIFLAMAHYEGEMLSRRLARGPLPLEEAIDVAAQAAQGLSKAHARNIVHRDISPANIFITVDGLVKILDFGVAKLAGEAKPARGAAPAASRYASPEQARGGEEDERSDIWSLGAVLYAMVSGRPPGDSRPPGALRPGAPAELARIVGKALAASAADRYQHAEDLMVDLKRLAKSTALDGVASQILGRGRESAPEAMRRPRRAIIVALCVAIAALALAAIAAILMRAAAR